MPAADLLRSILGPAYDEAALQRLAWEVGRVPWEEREDFTQLVALECLEAQAAGETLDQFALARIVHRVRKRIVRRAGREVPVDPASLAETLADRRSSPGVVARATLALQEFAAQANVIELALLHRVLLGGEPIAEAAAHLNLSPATAYRRLSKLRERLRQLAP